MRRLRSWLAVGLLLIPLATLTDAADAKVRKVLPSLVDLEGRASLHPSLYERDAYQAYLRKNPELVGGMRFDVHWSAPVAKAQPLELRLELRGATLRTNNAPAGVTQTNAVTLTNAAGSRWPLMRNEAMVREIAEQRDKGARVRVLAIMADWSITQGTAHTCACAKRFELPITRIEELCGR